MKFSHSLENLRTTSFATSYEWGVSFASEDTTDLPLYFRNYFPVVSVDESIYDVQSESIDIFTSAISYPKSLGQKTITITFHDDKNHSLETWMEDWVEKDIFNLNVDNSYVATLEEASKVFSVAKLLNDRRIAKLTSYRVIPTGGFVFSGTSQPDALLFTAEFNIIGKKVNSFINGTTIDIGDFEFF